MSYLYTDMSGHPHLADDVCYICAKPLVEEYGDDTSRCLCEDHLDAEVCDGCDKPVIERHAVLFSDGPAAMCDACMAVYGDELVECRTCKWRYHVDLDIAICGECDQCIANRWEAESRSIVDGDLVGVA